MNQGIKYGFLFALMLPLGAGAANSVSDEQALQSLDAITRRVDDAPALLLLTPAQLEAIDAPLEKKAALQTKRGNQLDKRTAEQNAASVRELKSQQAKINQLNAALAKQARELKKLREAAQANGDSHSEVESLKKSLQESLQKTEKMQQQLSAMNVLKSDKQQDSARLQQALGKSQQQSAELQRQVAALTAAQDERIKQHKSMQAALDDSRKHAEALQKQLAFLASQYQAKEQAAAAMQMALDERNKGQSELQKQLKALTEQHKAKEKTAITLQAERDESRKRGAEQQQRLTALISQDTAREKSTAALRAELDKNQKSAQELKEQLATLTAQSGEQEKKYAALLQELAGLKQQRTARKEMAAPPKTASEIRDYAIGSSLGNDVLALLQEKISQGIKINRRMAFSGVQDALQGKHQLEQEQIAKALYETEVALNEREKKLTAESKQQGLRYIEQFRKKKGVKKSATGFYYRIDYLGAGKINDADTVAVVVKESLTSGKVIKDMDVAGTSISQPLSSYPTMFRDAIKQLQNHGTMLMVVPPELAYGDKGLAPDIPPGSTMVYNIRILDVLPADGAAGNKK